MQGVSRRYRCLTRQPFTSGAGEFDRRDGFGCLSWGAGVYARLRRVVCRGIRAAPVGHQHMVEALFIYMPE